ncbi:F-box only protein 6 [Impatiens glandulifera]|uniref:F-box only protein 6 n=1 Tax=Impatiens glandulifera TaxID=253017 RepID=UPI001FB12E43|nr:F-box only protein 6 [Impatiens glandulifera]
MVKRQSRRGKGRVGNWRKKRTRTGEERERERERERRRRRRKKKKREGHTGFDWGMEELAMLRQFIAEAQELSEIYGYAVSSYNLHLQPPPLPPPLYDRWCFAKPNNGTADDSDFSFIMQNHPKPATFEMLEPWKPAPTKKSKKERSKGRSQIISSSTNGMDPAIWKEFPEDLFEAVVARLPTATFCRFRSVCQKWNSLLNSHSFSQQYDQIQPTLPWFYTITHDCLVSGAMYDPSSKKWYHPPLPVFQKKVIILPVASAGGLICFVDIGHKSFYLFNPLTGSLKELPARSSIRVWSRIAVGMTLNGKTTKEGYKILWLCCDGVYEVYDSIKNSWDRPGTMPSSVKLPLSLNFKSQAVCVEGCVYFMRSEPDGIVSYDMRSGVWKQFLSPSPNDRLSDQALAECGGKIMLVGLLTKNAVTCVCVWELQKMTLLWKEVDRMPNEWCLEFYGKHLKMSCLGNKGLLLLSLKSRQVYRLVTYDILKKEWLKVPGCALPHGRKRHWMACGTAFHPCITASA